MYDIYLTFYLLFVFPFVSLPFLSFFNSLSSITWNVCVHNSANILQVIASLMLACPTMSSLLSRLNPVPSFPSYTGPYSVGTQEVEIPVSDLPSTSPPPDANITTLSFRIFYPCKPTKPKPVYWLPSPQGEYFRAYARFMSAGPRLASFLSWVAQSLGFWWTD